MAQMEGVLVPGVCSMIDDREERAAIMEFHGGLTRKEAERLAGIRHEEEDIWKDFDEGHQEAARQSANQSTSREGAS